MIGMVDDNDELKMTYEEWKIQNKIEELVSYDLIKDQTGLVNTYIQEKTYDGARPHSILCKNYLATYFKSLGERTVKIETSFFWCPSITVVKSKETMREDLKNSSVIRDIAVKILNKKGR